MRAPIARSVSVSARLSVNSTAADTDMRVNSAMLIPPTVTARLVGFSRSPWQAGHGFSAMYSSIRSFW
jgi:hypothetical protein